MKNYIIALLIVLVLLATSYILINNNKVENNIIWVSMWKIEIVGWTKSLWEIPMDEWIIELVYEFTNTWSEDVILWWAQTWCGCTTGYVLDEDDWYQSELIQMPWIAPIVNLNKTIKRWQTLKLIVQFDPNAHWPDATGRVARNLMIQTNSKTTPILNFKFNWDIVKTKS